MVLCLISGVAFAETALIARRVSPQATMTVAFSGAKKVIVHPSGVVTEYTTDQIEANKARLVEQRDRLDAMIADSDSDVASAMGIAPVEKITPR